ncbi:MAG: hypothetical protein GWM90_01890 [Gemmatimonadetes bacterium]|nr:hypothetical protein [Gemmatimonadota bacterium]NIQ52357.1 hypothetical protein [Gemmatimonadota bacterium]NIU72468.1 hypothetical protein [Gammaproteobacteria bacterium]NIX42922.1 hypothetical protein [Gemmatimonadota bacterium]NIY07097.1 hypothetical protein [Gemmatimonadota bacterium]
MSRALEAARALLGRHGVDAPVDAVGVGGEILAVTGGPGLRTRLARLAPELRSLGFRYVALELEAGETDTRRDS